jgi:hypothetical protein
VESVCNVIGNNYRKHPNINTQQAVSCVPHIANSSKASRISACASDPFICM